MTSFDLLAAIKEIQPKLANSHLVNVYQASPNLLILKLRSRDAKTYQLVLEAARRIHLSNTRYKTPRLPPQFCLTLRKHLRNGILMNLTQHDLDRLAVLEIGNGSRSYRLIIELLDRGNILLTDDNLTIIATSARNLKTSRPTAKGSTYVFPRIRGLNLQETNPAEAFNLIQKSKSDVVRSLVQFLNLPGEVAEEICLRAGIEKETSANKITLLEVESILEQAKLLVKEIQGGPLQPTIARSSGTLESVIPRRFQLYKQSENTEFESFSEALEEYFREANLISRTQRETEATAKWEHVITAQIEAAAKLGQEAKRLRENGALIFASRTELDHLLTSLQQSKRQLGDWRGAIKAVQETDSYPHGLRLQLVDPKTGKISLIVSKTQIELDPLKQAAANASEYYERAKEAEGKAKRAMDSVEETRKKLETASVEVLGKRVEEKRTISRRFWYERFRWFISSEGCLAIGGRDAAQNDTLIKRYMEASDVVVHADVHGAPFVIIKPEQKPIGQQTIEETAQFAVSYSSAWKGGLGSADAYWVKPDQVSKSAPSGEYIGRGAFMIRGEKNILRGIPLGLSIGVQEEDGKVRIIGGPLRTIRARTEVMVNIVPGGTPPEKFAPQLRFRLSHLLRKEVADEVGRLDDSEFIRFLPQGGARFDQNKS